MMEDQQNEPVLQNPVVPPWHWPFLFPLNGTGLGMIGLFILCKIILGALAFVPVPLMQLVILILHVIVTAYIYWYLCLCVQVTAEGQTRAPDILQDDEGDFKDLIVRMFRLLIAAFVCFAPGLIYFIWTKKADETLWNIVAAGLFFLPMVLLSTILHDSLWGLNPILIVLSIIRTHVRYLLLVLCFCIPFGLYIALAIYSRHWGIWLTLPAEAIALYLAYVGSAMLGRFYYRNESHLDWGV
ncbi:MAG TPA: hypothetical protein PKB02_11260 [Anaerohalosphaeraceae bacterium]|nr:hypothetical protein [Anaerohalosphaeraceae bacterium]